MIHLPFPDNPKLFASDGHSEGTIPAREAQRLLKRGIVEIVIDATAIIGVMRLSKGLKAGEQTVILASHTAPAKFHRRQALNGCWCWQLKHADGRLVA